MDLSKCYTGKHLEAKTKKDLESQGNLVVRADYKNCLPDYLVVNKFNYPYFLECKNYRSYSSLIRAVNSWKRKQQKQYKNFKELNKKIDIEILFNLKNEHQLVSMDYIDDIRE